MTADQIWAVIGKFAAVYSDDDARRLVACWNAFDGLDTEMVESSLMTWQTGAPGKDEIEKEVIKSLQKVRQWFRDPQKTRVVMAIERRAVAAFRQQNTGN